MKNPRALKLQLLDVYNLATAAFLLEKVEIKMKNIIVLLIATLLISCKVVPDDHELINFDVIGTSEDIDGVAPISANTNNGNFVLRWEVDNKRSPYKIEAFVSYNDTLSDTDVRFYSETCSYDDCGDKNPYEQDCFFNNNNDISCGKDKANLQGFLDEIPKNAYIIIESCDIADSDCNHKVDAVRFE
jgi:hypothetical protein